MWRCSAAEPLVGCGIDAETIARFDRWTPPLSPPPFLFSDAEAAHCAGLDDPAIGLCAAFCAKEALFKALGRPYNFPDCQLLWRRSVRQYELRLDPALGREAGVWAAWARIGVRGGRECTAQVLAFGRGATP
jgi:phosphopantetheinyl transferase (holo-ACP synthase)